MTASSANSATVNNEAGDVRRGSGTNPSRAGHQVTSVPATQLVAVNRKDFPCQHEPTDAIIGIRHGQNPLLWA